MIADLVAPIEAPPAVIGASWSNWWGSPQLFAHLVAGIARESGKGTALVITFQADGHEETFDSVDVFLARVSPEMLRGFSRAECHAYGPVCETRLTMTRELVTVDVTAAEAQDAENALARIVDEANRGYQPFWGTASWPGQVARKTRYQRFGGSIRQCVDVAAAVAFGAVCTAAATRITGQDELPTWAFALIVVAGANVAFFLNRAVPAVEIAQRGRTRLRVLTTRLTGSAGALVVAQVLALLGLSSS